MSNPQEQIMTTSEAADLLGAHPGSVRKWIKKNKLPAVKHGRDWQIKLTDVEAFAKKQQQSKPGGQKR